MQLIVLRVLYEKSLHGYGLLEVVNKFLEGRRKLKPGSLYTILRRMEQAGLLKSEWESTVGPDRRVYALTEEGIERLSQGRRVVEAQRRVLEEMEEFYRTRFGEETGER